MLLLIQIILFILVIHTKFQLKYLRINSLSASYINIFCSIFQIVTEMFQWTSPLIHRERNNNILKNINQLEAGIIKTVHRKISVFCFMLCTFFISTYFEGYFYIQFHDVKKSKDL